MKTNGISICNKAIMSKAMKLCVDAIFYRHQMEPQVRGT